MIAVVGFLAFNPSGYGVDETPVVALFVVQAFLLFFRKLFKRNIFFHRFVTPFFDFRALTRICVQSCTHINYIIVSVCFQYFFKNNTLARCKGMLLIYFVIVVQSKSGFASTIRISMGSPVRNTYRRLLLSYPMMAFSIRLNDPLESLVFS